jgi:hypothetical protein
MDDTSEISDNSGNSGLSMADRKIRVAVASAVVVVLVGTGVWLLGPGGDGARGGDARSPEETIYGYVDAYREGDCEAMVGFVSRAVWSDGGRLTRREYVDRCDEAVNRRERPPDVVVVAGRDLDPLGEEESAEPRDRSGNGDRDDRVTVPVRTVLNYEADNYVVFDEATLVRERRDWRLDVADDVELTEGDAGPLDSLDNFELEPLVLGEPVEGFRPVPAWPGSSFESHTGPVFADGLAGSPITEDLSGVPTGFGQGFRRLFVSESDPSARLAVTLLAFTHDREGVDDAFDRLGGDIERRYVGYSSYYRAAVPLDVSSVAPDGIGFVVPEIDEFGYPHRPSDLRGAIVMTAQDDILVVVEVTNAVGSAASDPAVEILAAQLARIPSRSTG